MLYSGSFVTDGDPFTDEGTVAGVPAAETDAAGLTFNGNSYAFGGTTYKLKDNQTVAYGAYMYMTNGATYRFVKNFDDSGLVRITDPEGKVTEVLKDTAYGNVTYGHYAPSASGWHKLDIRCGNGTGGVGPAKSPFNDKLLAGLAWTDSAEVTSDSCTTDNYQHWKRFENGETPVFCRERVSLSLAEPITDELLVADAIGAVVASIPDQKPGAVWHVELYATNAAHGASKVTECRSVTVPSGAAVTEAAATSDSASYTVAGKVVPGLGMTYVYLRWGFDGLVLDHEELLAELSFGEDGSYAKKIDAPQTGSTLHWQVVCSNAYSCATWGDYSWGDGTEPTGKILTDATTVAWTWQTAGAGDWQTAANWSATGKTGFPNAAGAQALFTTATSGATVTSKDDVTLKLLKVTGAKVTVDAANHALAPTAITYEKGTNGESVDVTFKNVVNGLPQPTVPADPGVAGVTKVTYLDSSVTLPETSHPANTFYAIDGGSLAWNGNYVRGEGGAAVSNRTLVAVNGAQVALNGFAHLGSPKAESPHAFIVTDGARLTLGGGQNRTFLHSNIAVAVTNATLGMGSGGARYAMGFADDSRFDLNGATLDCSWKLGRRSRAYVTGVCAFAGSGPELMSRYSWDNNEDKARKGVFSSQDCEILVEKAMVTDANRLGYVYGTNNVIRIRDSVVTMNQQLSFAKDYGNNSQFIVDNSVVTNKAHMLNFDEQTGVPNSALVFCGEAPRYVVTGNGSGVSCDLGTDAAQTDPAEIRFELPREGFAEAPLQFRAKYNGNIRAHLPIRVDAKKYKRMSRYTVPLISMDKGWKTKASAEAIAANLPAGALPERSKLVWVGKDLCLEMPPMGGLILTIR